MKKYYFETKNYYFYIDFPRVFKASAKKFYKFIFTAIGVYSAIILFEISILLVYKILNLII